MSTTGRRLSLAERASVVRTWRETGSIAAARAAVGGLASFRAREVVREAALAGVDCTPPNGEMPVWLAPHWPLLAMRRELGLNELAMDPDP